MDNRYGGEPIPDLIVVSVVVLLPIVKKWNCQSTDCQRSKTNVSQIACLCSNFDQRMGCVCIDAFKFPYSCSTTMASYGLSL